MTKTQGRNTMDDFKENTLKSHVQLCELRYKALETRLDNVEAKLVKLEADLSILKASINTGFTDVKLALQAKDNQRFVQLVATMGAVIVAIIGAAAVILTR